METCHTLILVFTELVDGIVAVVGEKVLVI